MRARAGLSLSQRNFGTTCSPAATPSAGSRQSSSCASGTQPEGWDQLEADLRTQHLSRDAAVEPSTPYGQKYVIRATLVGPTGHSAAVVSVWVVRRGEDAPRFVTAYPGGA